MSLEIAPDLVRRLKRLRLGGLLPTLPDRATHARQAKLSLWSSWSCYFYGVLVERDRRAPTMITSNRAVDEWVALFDDPSSPTAPSTALRIARIVMEGPSLRAARAPRHARGPGRPPNDAAQGG